MPQLVKYPVSCATAWLWMINWLPLLRRDLSRSYVRKMSAQSAIPPSPPEGLVAPKPGESSTSQNALSRISQALVHERHSPMHRSRLGRQWWQAQPCLHKLGTIRSPASVRGFNQLEMCHRRPSYLDVERQGWLSTTPARRIAWAKMARVLKNV